MGVKHLLNGVSYAVLLGAGVIMLQGALWLTYPMTPWKLNKPISVMSPVVFRGEALQFEMDYCKHPAVADVQSVVHYAFIDAVSYAVPGNFLELQQTGCRVVYEGVMVPTTLPPGRYRLEMVRVFPANPLRTIQIASVSDYFEVR